MVPTLGLHGPQFGIMYLTMVLKDYLAQQGIKLSDLAALAEFGQRFTPTVSGHAVRKWARGERIPRVEMLRQMSDITEGQVSMTDVLDKRVA